MLTASKVGILHSTPQHEHLRGRRVAMNESQVSQRIRKVCEQATSKINRNKVEIKKARNYVLNRVASFSDGSTLAYAARFTIGTPVET